MQRPLTFELSPVVPFCLEFTVWALRRRRQNEVDRWDGTTYRRLIRLQGRAVEVDVRELGSREASRLAVSVAGERMPAETKFQVEALLIGMLGLQVDLKPFYRMAARDPKLRRLAERYRGLKPVRFPTMFETLANAIACQQFTISAGLQLLNRLASTGTTSLTTETGAVFGFPEPSDLLRLPSDAFRKIGFSRQKTNAFRELSRNLVSKQIDLDCLEGRKNDDVVRFLLGLRGVGRWTAEYALLRGLGRLDVFPGDDVGARNGLARWLRRSKPMDYARVQRAMARWQPYAGFIYFHMLMESLAARGEVCPA